MVSATETGNDSSGQRHGGMKLGVILDGAGATAEGWRRPDVQPNASVDIQWYISQTRKAEAALLDFAFIADTLFITPDTAPHMLNRLEPLTLLSAVAAHTSHIGLVATISTLFTEPFTVARQMASLDLISGGRAAWNIVTSAVAAAALNHSQAADFGTADRYRRAAEHVAACQGLWDSWEPDAFIYDKATGVYFDKDKLHTLDFKGTYHQALGPLNIQCSRQGHPVLFQAGASGEGRDLAARFADAIFAMTSNMDEAKAYADDVKGRTEKFGRSPEDLVFMTRISPLIGANQAEVDELYRETTRQVDIADALYALGLFFGGHDFTGYPLQAPFPDLETASAEAPDRMKGADRLSYIETATPAQFLSDVRQRKLSLQDAALEFMTPKTDFIGTAESVADAMERWYLNHAADGFIIRGGDFAAFTQLCLPILQERGLFRTQYEADTLRGNLGLPASTNRYALARRKTEAAIQNQMDMPVS